MKRGEYRLKWTPLTAEEQKLVRSIAVALSYSQAGPAAYDLPPFASSLVVELHSMQTVSAEVWTVGREGQEGGKALLSLTAPDFGPDTPTPPKPMPPIKGLSIELVRIIEGTMKTARAEDGSTIELYEDRDNWTALQAFLDAHTAIQLPDGTFPITKTLNLSTNHVFSGAGAERTTLVKTGADASLGPVVGVAGAGAWPGSEGRGAQADVSLFRMTLDQQTDLHVLDKCLMVHEGCTNFLAEEFRVKNSPYEGIVVSNSVLGCTLRNFECVDCGNGGAHYAFSTAGMNATCGELVAEDFRTSGCGQGVECGNTNVTVRRAHVGNPGAGLPSIGINIGSTGYGVHNTVVEDCVVDGYDSSIGCGNGIGRLSKVIIRRNKIYDDGGVDETQASPIGFAGGNETNNVQHDNQGPDLYGSEITDNEIHVSIPHQGAIAYNSSPNQDGTWGREPLLIARNTIYMEGVSSEQTHPLVNFAGEVSGECIVEDNLFYGLDEAPDRGDVQSNSLTGNQAIQGMPNLTVRGNHAYKTDGSTRAIVVNIEGA